MSEQPFSSSSNTHEKSPASEPEVSSSPAEQQNNAEQRKSREQQEAQKRKEEEENAERIANTHFQDDTSPAQRPTSTAEDATVSSDTNPKEKLQEFITMVSQKLNEILKEILAFIQGIGEAIRGLRGGGSQENPERAVRAAVKFVNKESNEEQTFLHEVFTPGDDQKFVNEVNFIRRQKDDFPKNAALQQENIARIVVLKDKSGGTERTVVALDANNTVIGMAKEILPG